MSKNIPQDFEDVVNILINFPHPDTRLYKRLAVALAVALQENYFKPDGPGTDLEIGEMYEKTMSTEELDRMTIAHFKEMMLKHQAKQASDRNQ